MRLLAEDLITSLKLRSMAPMSQNTFTTAYFLQILNEEMKSKLIPLIQGIRENYFLTYKRTTIEANRYRYPLPERAIGNALKDLCFVDNSGNRARRVARTDAHLLPASTISSSNVEHVLLFGDELFLVPTPNAAIGSLEQWFYSRPNDLVSTSSCAKITAVSSVGGTTTFTVDTDLTASLSVGSKVDFLSSKSPFLLWSEDATITAITATTIAVATSEVSNEISSVEPLVNDYICPAKSANIPMFPEELHPILAQMGAVRVLKSLGDANKTAMAKAELDELAAAAKMVLANRIESSVMPVYNPRGIHSAMGS